MRYSFSKYIHLEDKGYTCSFSSFGKVSYCIYSQSKVLSSLFERDPLTRIYLSESDSA